MPFAKPVQLVIALVAAALAVLFIYIGNPIDRCLDRGRCWDSVEKICRNPGQPNEQAMCDRGKEVQVGD